MKNNALLEGLDSAQRQAVCTDKNAVVIAGAGSGKTRVLTTRFLYLVTEKGIKPSKIMALTFTRKAANEMRQRITEGIKNSNDNDIIKDFENAVISTIDSFCSSVVRPYSSRYGFAPDFAVCNGEDIDGLLSHAQAFFMQAINKDEYREALKSLCMDWEPEQIIDRLLVDYAVNHALVTGYYCDNDSYKEYLQDNVDKRFYELKASCRELFSDCRAVYDLIGSGAAKSKEKLNKAFCVEDELFSLLDEGPDRILEIKSLISSLDLSRISKDGINPNKIKKASLGLAESIESLLLYIDKSVVLNAFMRDWHESVLKFKRKRNMLTFSDVFAAAVDLLRNDEGIRTYYKNRFDYILVDEFQDNNELQKEFLFLLAEKKGAFSSCVTDINQLEKGKLFIVGDEKQSIYLFRGADVSVFNRLRQDAANDNYPDIELIRLEHNYRSEPSLVEFFNSVSGTVFDSDDGDEIAFEPAKTRSDDESVIPSVIVGIQKKEEKDISLDNDQSRDDIEAAWVAKKIKSLVENKTLKVRDKRTKELRPIGYGDVAILMRSTTAQLSYEKALRKNDIPYVSAVSRNMFLEAPVNDLVSWLFVLVYPDDWVSFYAVLRGPLCALDDDDIAKIILREKGKKYAACFSISDDELDELLLNNPDAYKRGKKIYLALSEMADREPPSELIRYLWYDAGYRFLLLKRKDFHPFLRFYDELVFLCRSFEGYSLSAFVDYLYDMLGRFEKQEIEDVPVDSDNSVKIMTIHASKGLEFPLVALVSVGKSSRSDSEKNYPYALLDNSYPVFSFARSNAVLKDFITRRKKLEDYELKRLLYVSLTRAESHLIIAGSVPSRNTGSSFMNLLLEDVEDIRLGLCNDDVLEKLSFSKEEIVPPDNVYAKQDVSRLSDFAKFYSSCRSYDRPDVIYRLNASDISDKYEERFYDKSSGNASGDGLEYASYYGSLVHFMIENASCLDKKEELMRYVMLNPDSVIGSGFELTEQDKQDSQSDYDDFKDMFESAYKAVLGFADRIDLYSLKHEYPLEVRYRDCYIHGRLDAVSFEGDNLVIYEWKTGKASAEKYRMQVFLYLKMASMVWNDKMLSLKLVSIADDGSVDVYDFSMNDDWSYEAAFLEEFIDSYKRALSCDSEPEQNWEQRDFV